MMDARLVVNFFKTRLGVMILCATGLALLLLFINDRRASKTKAPPATSITNPVNEPESTKYEREVTELPINPPTKVENYIYTSDTSRRPVYEKVSIYTKPTAAPEPPVAQPDLKKFSSQTAPFGRLIKCELLTTLESNKIQTPVIGIVMEDVWWNGNLIVPAGSEVHGRAVVDRTRDRIGSANQWTVVFPAFEGNNQVNGAELVIKGLALDRDEDMVVQQPGDSPSTWGLLDGSWGLRGDVIREDKYAALKVIGAGFLAEASRTLISRTVTGTGGFIGGAVVQNDSTLSNAAMAGANQALEHYIEQMQREIQEYGSYIRVRAGKPFYLYVMQTMDVSNARIGDSLIGDQIQSNQSRQSFEQEIRRNESTRPLVISGPSTKTDGSDPAVRSSYNGPLLNQKNNVQLQSGDLR